MQVFIKNLELDKHKIDSIKEANARYYDNFYISRKLRGLVISGPSEIIKKQNGGFVNIIDILGSSILGNMLAGERTRKTS